MSHAEIKEAPVNVVYRIECQECLSAGKKAQYQGETSRTFFDRYREYRRSLDTKTGASCVLKHWEEHHPDLQEPPKFTFSVTHRCKTASERQIREALEIENFKGEITMNGKAEWGRNFVPRRVVFHQEEIWSPDEEREEEQRRSEENSSRKRKDMREREQEERERISGDNFSSQLSQRRKRRREEAQSERKEENGNADGNQLPNVLQRVVAPQNVNIKKKSLS